MNSTPSAEERLAAALAWLRGPITALVVSHVHPNSPFVAFQTRQAIRFYTTAFVTALVVEALLLPFLLILLLAWEFLVVLTMLPLIGGTLGSAGGEEVFPIALALLFLGVLLVSILAVLPAGLILGSAHLVGLVVALSVWQGHNVRLPLFARWAERRRDQQRRTSGPLG